MHDNLPIFLFFHLDVQLGRRKENTYNLFKHANLYFRQLENLEHRVSRDIYTILSLLEGNRVVPSQPCHTTPYPARSVSQPSDIAQVLWKKDALFLAIWKPLMDSFLSSLGTLIWQMKIFMVFKKYFLIFRENKLGCFIVTIIDSVIIWLTVLLYTLII